MQKLRILLLAAFFVSPSLCVGAQSNTDIGPIENGGASSSSSANLNSLFPPQKEFHMETLYDVEGSGLLTVHCPIEMRSVTIELDEDAHGKTYRELAQEAVEKHTSDTSPEEEWRVVQIVRTYNGEVWQLLVDFTDNRYVQKKSYSFSSSLSNININVQSQVPTCP